MPPHEKKNRCQSCGMTLEEGVFGTEAGGGASSEYCKFCYALGAFTEPTITMDEMIKTSIRHMTRDNAMNEETAEHLMKNIIPTLRRWRNAG